MLNRLNQNWTAGFRNRDQSLYAQNVLSAKLRENTKCFGEMIPPHRLTKNDWKRYDTVVVGMVVQRRMPVSRIENHVF